ncbi:MAG TPA: 16S rRNA (guanine(966)-N(2))-methyltransferase RsmD [Bacillales bacterium]
MRVIAGTCKGRPLKPVPGRSTRPTTDKVKEALFNRIGPFFEGGKGLDLYGGSGALGIEALSRGLDEMILVDRDPKAIGTIKQNISHCGFGERAEIYRNDAHRALKVIQKRGLRFKLVFLDPPYFHQKIASDLEKIDQFKMLEPGGLAVVEHHEDVKLCDTYGHLVLDSKDTYGGKTVISLYKISANEE